MEPKKNRYGLLGRNISYSFSRGYFTQKFESEGLTDYSYENFDLPDLSSLRSQVFDDASIKGINVTIPYKTEVIPQLDELRGAADKIQAVNTIAREGDRLIGYNTDVIGFKNSLLPHLKSHHKQALILGTGGASKAVGFVLAQLNIHHQWVSRTPDQGQIAYRDIDEKIAGSHLLVIQCSPLGTYPNIEQKPEFPYRYLTERHLLFDLIYNPEITAFMKAGISQGAQAVNGYQMLVEQAEEAWRIWSK